jgi:HDOD domain
MCRRSTWQGPEVMDSATSRKELHPRRIERALNHVSDYWFPCQPELLSQVAKLLSGEAISWNPQEVFTLVRSDFSLFIRMLGELNSLLINEEGRGIEESEPPINPLDIFERSGHDSIRRAFAKITERRISAHGFNSLTDSQAQRFEEAYVSASTVEALAEGSEVNPEIGYSSALLRQLGLTLIAFNYPTVYDKVINSLKPGDSVDTKLSEILGFTPSLLAVKLLHRWGFSKPLLETVMTDEKEEEAHRTFAITSAVSKLCEVGEALARANNPEQYPAASRDWDFARSEIERVLGKRGLATVRKCVKENTKRFIKSAPSFFKGGIVLDPEIKIAQVWDNEHLKRNPFLSACETGFKEELHKVYERLLAGFDSSACLSMLVRDAIPKAGFSGGCLYTLDLPSKLLIPQLKLGEVTERELVPVSLRDEHDLVTRALQSLSPLSARTPSNATAIAGVLGYSQRMGVLYVELKDTADIDYLAHLRALSKSFCDALRLT